MKKRLNNDAMRENIRQFVIYLFVGACATIVEWVVFYVLRRTMLFIHYMPATAIAFILSTFANWLAGKWLLFQQKQNIWKELAKIYATSVAGLLMNLLIMWIAIDLMGIQDMIAKIIATGIVFFWNFLVRKLLIYKI